MQALYKKDLVSFIFQVPVARNLFPDENEKRPSFFLFFFEQISLYSLSLATDNFYLLFIFLSFRLQLHEIYFLMKMKTSLLSWNSY